MTRAIPHSPDARAAKIALLSLMAIAMFACDKLDTQPGEFQYPLSLSVERKQSIAELTWSEATVSTFEEYIILRSTDEIPDSPEPEITGNTVLLARIDERKATLFKDSNLPIADSIYYKVYARIAGHLLMSPTVGFTQNLHLVPVRADIVEHVPSQNAFIGFDRVTQQLFVYDYSIREFLVSRFFQLNFPVISYSASPQEILISENGTTQFLDYTTLNVIKTFQTNQIRNVKYANGWIYLTRAQFPFGFALYRRSDLSFRDEVNALQSDWRGFSVIPDVNDANKATIYDFSLTGSARYVQNNTTLEVDLLSSEVLPGGLMVVARHPVRTEFVITNTGIIVDGNLQIIKTLENGTLSFSFWAYSPDGSRLFGMTFQNNLMIRVYDAENDYSFVEEYVLSNQISPVALFTDEDNMYLVSLVFLNTSTQTLITTIEY